MKNSKMLGKKMSVLIAFIFMSLSIYAQNKGQEKKGEKMAQKETKLNDKDIKKTEKETLKAAIESIENDANLNSEEKEILIKAKKEEWKSLNGKNKGKERNSDKATLNAEIEEIRNNTSLTEEEKKALIKEKKAAEKELRKATMNQAKKSKISKEKSERTKTQLSQLTTKLDKDLASGKITKVQYEERMAKIELILARVNDNSKKLNESENKSHQK